jgi:acetyl esterase/lipase
VRVVIVIATLLVVPTAVAVLCTYLYDTPYIGLATAYVPWYLPWLVVASLIGGALAVGYWRGCRAHIGAALAILALVTVVAAVVIDVRMIAAVERAGADISVIDTFGIGAPKRAAPDGEVTYAAFAGEPLRLSIYRPHASTKRAPILVYIHGGGWVAGDLDSRSTDLRWFADQGWLVISIDYTLSSADRHLWDVTQGQIGCALGWIVANAPTYGGDPTRLSVSGHSAGGNLAINTAYLAAAGRLPSLCGGTMPRVAAVSAMYPVVDAVGFYDNPDRALGGRSRAMAGAYTGGSPQRFPGRYAGISSGTYITAAAPPTLIVVGEADHLVPVGGTYRFAERATQAGVAVGLVAVPYADHVFDGRPGSIGEQAYRQLTARWLRDHGQSP